MDDPSPSYAIVVDTTRAFITVVLTLWGAVLCIAVVSLWCPSVLAGTFKMCLFEVHEPFMPISLRPGQVEVCAARAVVGFAVRCLRACSLPEILGKHLILS